MRVFIVAWLAYATVLLSSSRDLFSRIVFEEGDAATVSIQVLAAKHFELLVGNYSRVGFHHPGPAFVYVQAFGEWLFYDVLHLVPAPWNGQAVAILLLNAAMVALALSIVHDWYPSWTLTAGIGGASLLFLTVYRELLSALWFPYVYFAPFLVLLVAVSSVVAGRTEHLWVVALAGGLLIHGHAEFLFFVPLLGGAALYLVWRRRLEVARKDWWLFGGIAAVFASTIVLDAIVHFPGELVKYVSYGGGHGIHMPWTAAWYTVQFWGPNHGLGIVIFIALFALVALVARGEKFLETGLAVCAAIVPLMSIYAMIGIDQIDEAYIGYFSYAVPLFMFALLLAGVTQRVRRLEFAGADRLKFAGVGLLVIGIVVSGLTHSLANKRSEMAGVPTTLDAMARAAGSRPIVLESRPHEAWAEVVPLVLSGARAGIRVCADDATRMELLVTAAFVCTPTELATGVHFAVTRKAAGAPVGQVIGEVGHGVGSQGSWVTTLG
ncbi:hypothetical protein GFY24_04020 [Nocardia sp. SYP-A9097]|uniref:hypothetical protein n=1 Tax=Nocardia sp. SYP-A9097 TaxID=2663237 RepID=UPI00129A14E0|nr:hypothetical protein [Nocardia sp. SYP-A9097]MRH86645.1 hypothetical protein [Nocardia sp. SYP-A9097]